MLTLFFKNKSNVMGYKGFERKLKTICLQSSQGSSPYSTAMNTDKEKNKVENIKQHVFSVAPMMEYTDRHMRRLHRLISAESVLYTEMITTNTLVRCEDPYRYLEADFTEEEPLVLQLGGSCTEGMKKASAMAAKIGYKEININAGCPSEKVR